MAREREGPLVLCLFALLFSVYLLTFSGAYHSSDEMSMLAVTDSLARRGAWDIELLHWMGEQQGSFGPDGLLYSRKGIGTTLAALPHYWLALQSRHMANVQTAMLTNGVVTALTGVWVYLFLRRLQYSRGVSLGTALAFGLGTMAWPYARYLFSESLAGLGLVMAAYFLLPLQVPERPSFERQDGSPAGRQIKPGRLLLAGSGLGIALLARLNNAIVAPVLGLLLVHYLYRVHGWKARAWIRPVVLFGLPVLAALLVAGWYNWLRFGSPLTTGYLPEERFTTPFFEGLYGLTFSPGKGLFWYNPILFAALVAWPAFFRRHRAEALLAGAAALINLAFYAPWFLWWAGHSWGPRFLVTILPFASLSLAPALEAVRGGIRAGASFQRRALAVALAILAILSVAVQCLGVTVHYSLYLEEVYAELGLYHPDTLFNPAYSPLLRQVAYLQPGNLDLAWARNGAVHWSALLSSLGLVLISGLVLWVAWRRRPSLRAGWGVLVLLLLGTVLALVQYAPAGDMAQAATALEIMERPGDAATVTDLLLTEPYQDAYDGRMWTWGVPAKEEVKAGQEATWMVGAGDAGPAAARFQVGSLRLDYFPPPGSVFETSRLPVPLLESELRLGEAIQLVAIEIKDMTIRPGEILPVSLYWRALAPMETSYTVSVQAIDEQGVKASQLDRVPCEGGCPTDGWQPGNLVGERYDLHIRDDTLPGSYRLIAGMYDLATGQNLSWLDADDNDLGPHLLVGRLQVQP